MIRLTTRIIAPHSPTLRLSMIFAAGWTLIFLAIAVFGWTATWSGLGVPSISPPFADMRTVQSGLDAARDGFNPQQHNPGDPFGRLMNYPSIWLTIGSVFGLQHETNYVLFEIGIVFLYLFSCLLLIRRHGSLWLLALAFSGASMLAVERGNNDLLVFCLIYCAVSASPLLGAPAFLAAVALKVYPVFALPSLTRNAWLALLLGAISVGLLVSMSSELWLIKTATPVSSGLSYGASSIALAVERRSGFHLDPWVVVMIMSAAAAGVAILADRSRILVSTNSNEHCKRLFLAGAGVYVGTFVLASNFDYRLILLQLCVPYIDRTTTGIARSGILLAIVIASNEMLLTAAIGRIGAATAVLSKSFLFVVLLILFLREAKSALSYFGIYRSKSKDDTACSLRFDPNIKPLTNDNQDDNV